jgi:hypothetical protein
MAKLDERQELLGKALGAICVADEAVISVLVLVDAEGQVTISTAGQKLFATRENLAALLRHAIEALEDERCPAVAFTLDASKEEA